MITNYLKQFTLATIGTGCIALGIATEAQAAVFSGSLQLNGFGFEAADNQAMITSPFQMYGSGTEDLATWQGFGNVSSDNFFNVSSDNPIESFFVFEDQYDFTLTSATEEDTNGNGITYSFTGYIEDEGDINNFTGLLTAQSSGSSWSASIETVADVPEPSTMISLLGVTALGMTSLRKAKSK